MKLKSLTAHNFVTYKELDIPSFPASGLIGLTGWNYDSPIMGSNAVGKSLFMDMITYAWHGEVVRKKRANIVGGFDKSMRLEIVIVDPTNGDEFIIRRTKGKTSGEKVAFVVNGERFLGTPSKIQPIIDRAFGMSWLTAKNCIIYSDEASHDHFMHCNDAKQKEIFSEIADILHLRVARKLIMRDLKEAMKALRFTQGKLTSARERKEDAESRLKESQAKLDNFETKTKNEAKRIRTKIAEKEEEGKKLDKIQKKIDRVKEEIEDLSVNLWMIQKKLRDIDTEKLHSKHQKAVKARARQHGMIWQHSENVQDANRTGECPTCFEPMTKKTKARMEKITKARSIKFDELCEKEKKTFRACTAAQQLEDEHRKTELTIEHHRLLIAQKEKKVERFKTIEAKIKGLKHKLRNIDTLSEEYQGEVEKSEKELASSQRRFSKLFFEEKKQLQGIEAMEFWRRKYGPNELEADFIEDLIAELEAEANRNIQDLTDGSLRIRINPSRVTPSGEKQEIVIEVIDAQEEKEFRLYSGGQKNRIEKAISIGLMSLQEGHIKLKLFDEIGKNLSPEGYERVVALMKETFNGHQIFIATNNNEIQKFFDYRMKVSMRNGKSRIKTNW